MYTNCPQCGEEVQINEMPTATDDTQQVTCQACGHSFHPTDVRQKAAGA